MAECSSSGGGGNNSMFDFTKKTWRDDVTFIIEDNRLYASKSILGFASPVFEAMFGTSFRESQANEIQLPGKNYDDFYEFLQFLYPRSQKKLTIQNVYKMLPLADEYQVEFLMKMCRNFLDNKLRKGVLPPGDILLCHGLATQYKFQDLREKCADELAFVNLNEVEELDQTIPDVDRRILVYKDLLHKKENILQTKDTELAKFRIAGETIWNLPLVPGYEDAKGFILEFKPVVSRLKTEVQNSRRVKLWNMSFYTGVSMETQGEVDHLSVFLTCDFDTSTDDLVSHCKAKLVIKNSLIGQSKNVNLIIEDADFQSKSDKRSWGSDTIRNCTAIPGFVEDDKLTLIWNVLVKKPVIDTSAD